LSYPRQTGDYAPLRECGIEVANKTACIHARPVRDLIHFLHSLSLQTGGLKKLKTELLPRFKAPPKLKKQYDWNESCYHNPERFEQFLKELCVNPLWEITSPENAEVESHLYRERIIESGLVRDFTYERDCQWMLGRFSSPRLHYFDDIVGALFEYQKQFVKQARADFLVTAPAKEIIEALDYGLRFRKCVLIRGLAGIGKTHTVKAWCDWRRGEARYVQLGESTNKEIFFRHIAESCGLPCSPGLSLLRMRALVEHYLKKAKLFLVIDEAQYLFSKTLKVTREPELVNWLLTDCFNRDVPFALSATLEFDRHRMAVEQQTNWASEQFSRRIPKAIVIKAPPTEEDLTAVALRRAKHVSLSVIKYLVGYAMTSKRGFDAINEALDDAQMIASEEGRERFIGNDIQRAIKVFRMPSDLLLKRVSEDQHGKKRRVPMRHYGEAADPPQDAGSGAARPENLAAHKAALISPRDRGNSVLPVAGVAQD